MVFLVANSHHKGLDSKIITVHETASEDDSMISSATHAARPVLSTRHCRWVNDELVRLHIQRRCSLEAGHIAAVTKLGLGVAAQHSEVANIVQPPFLLLLTTK